MINDQCIEIKKAVKGTRCLKELVIWYFAFLVWILAFQLLLLVNPSCLKTGFYVLNLSSLDKWQIAWKVNKSWGLVHHYIDPVSR